MRVKVLRQQSRIFGHQNRVMLKRSPQLLLLILFSLFLSGCISPKEKVVTPKLLKTEKAEQAQLFGEVNRFARINSMRAKMYLKFEDNSFAESGIRGRSRRAADASRRSEGSPRDGGELSQTIGGDGRSRRSE